MAADHDGVADCKVTIAPPPLDARLAGPSVAIPALASRSELLDTSTMEQPSPKDRQSQAGRGEVSPGGRLGLALSVAISVAALGLAAAHLIWPEVRLDSITLGLLAIALLPWLGVIFKSVELPFGVRVEYQELKNRLEHQAGRLDEVAARVDSVENRMFQFTGVATPALETAMDEALRNYVTYLDRLGLVWAGELPQVHTEERLEIEGMFAYHDFEHNRIILSKKAAGDVDIALSEFTHWLLWDRQGGGNRFKGGRELDRADVLMWEIENGLARYLPCSHRNDPRLGIGIGQEAGKTALFDLAEPKTFDEMESLRESQTPSGPAAEVRYFAPQIWASLFWALRTTLGQGEADTLLVRAWSSTKQSDQFDRRFVEQLLILAPDDHRKHIENVLARHRYKT